MCKQCEQNAWADLIQPCPRLERMERVLYWSNLAIIAAGLVLCAALAFGIL